MSSSKRWLPLESNPEVLNDFTTRLGLDSNQFSFSDVFGLDEELLAMVPQPVHAVIMCYPITEESEKAAKQEDEEQAAKGVKPDADLFYMKQTIGNACGTIALLHSVLNNRGALQPAAGSFLARFLEATQGMDPAAVGAFLENPPEGAPDIEAAHQAAAAEGATAPPNPDEDVDLHFVALVEHKGQLWELDGRRAGPVCHGATSRDSLLADSAKVVREFVSRTNSLNFNLLALTGAPQEA